MSNVVFVVAGDPNSLTGGFAYNRRMVEGLRARMGIEAIQFDITGLNASEVSSRLMDSQLALIDSIALSEAHIVGIAGSLVERPEPRPLVGVLMHMLPSELAEKGNPKILAETELRLLPLAELVITVSDYLATRLYECGARPERTFVIPPGRDAAGSSLSSQPAQEKKFVSVANWVPAKGIDLLLRAFAEADIDAVLELIGSTPDRAYAQSIHNLIEELELGSRVRIIDSASVEALAQTYSGAYAFLFASLSEGYPTVLAEALNASLPIVAFGIPPVIDLVRDAGILVPPFEVDQLSSAIRSLADDPSRRAELARAATVRAKELPTWDQSVSRFVQVVAASISSDLLK